MSNIRLILAAAGSGKTELIVREAIDNPTCPSLLTTFTQANEKSIKDRIISICRCIPEHITVKTWDSFLLQHGIRPYQGCMSSYLRSNFIAGMLWVESQSVRYKSEANNFLEHFFHDSNGSLFVYSDKIAKLAVRCGEKSNGASTSRIARIFPRIYIDECQDLAGYDLEFLLQLGMYTSELILVGDPRQVTYLTHWESKNKKYRGGGIRNFLYDRRVPFIFDEHTLRESHRNHVSICEYAALLYPANTPGVSCRCCNHEEDSHHGIFCIAPDEVPLYADRFEGCAQLRFNKSTSVNESIQTFNYGQSKGMTFDRTIIYPTNDIRKWIFNRSANLSEQTRAKLYVAITRARYSVAFVLDKRFGVPPGVVRYVFE